MGKNNKTGIYKVFRDEGETYGSFSMMEAVSKGNVSIPLYNTKAKSVNEPTK